MSGNSGSQFGRNCIAMGAVQPGRPEWKIDWGKVPSLNSQHSGKSQKHGSPISHSSCVFSEIQLDIRLHLLLLPEGRIAAQP